MADFYADEHVPFLLTAALRRLGHDVTEVRQTSKNKSGDGDDDSFVLEYATQHKRIVLTFNESDFRQLHHVRRGHYGIILSSHDSDYTKLARLIDSVLKARGVLNGQIITVKHTLDQQKRKRPRKKPPPDGT